MYPSDYRYTKEHEWIKVSGGTGTIGITDYAQQQLGDVVYIDLPEVGATLKQGQSFGTIESVKAVSELYSPVSGEVVNVNSALKDKPETVNADPHGSWMIVVKLTNPGESSALLDAGRALDVRPCGLGARDTLRLEAGMRLHGNDIDETTTAVEADLNWIVGWKKDDFVGAAALRDQKSNGAARKIVGFEMSDPGIARHGYEAYVGDTKAGVVTSGTQTPFLKKAIGMAYLPAAHTAAGSEFAVDIRGRRARARVVPMPFYKRPR